MVAWLVHWLVGRLVAYLLGWLVVHAHILIGRKQDVCNVEVNGQKVEQVEVMKYLGAMISSDGSMDSEVEQRIGMASKMIGAIGRTVLGRKELTKGTKVRVVNAVVIPTLTYGWEPNDQTTK